MHSKPCCSAKRAQCSTRRMPSSLSIGGFLYGAKMALPNPEVGKTVCWPAGLSSDSRQPHGAAASSWALPVAISTDRRLSQTQCLSRRW